jgi:hypothetical protein
VEVAAECRGRHVRRLQQPPVSVSRLRQPAQASLRRSEVLPPQLAVPASQPQAAACSAAAALPWSPADPRPSSASSSIWTRKRRRAEV